MMDAWLLYKVVMSRIYIVVIHTVLSRIVWLYFCAS